MVEYCFYNAGRTFSLERDTKIEYENGEYSVLIENGIQEAPKIIFLTKRLNDSKLFQNIEGKVYIAFLPHHLFQKKECLIGIYH